MPAYSVVKDLCVPCFRTVSLPVRRRTLKKESGQ